VSLCMYKGPCLEKLPAVLIKFTPLPPSLPLATSMLHTIFTPPPWGSMTDLQLWVVHSDVLPAGWP